MARPESDSQLDWASIVAAPMLILNGIAKEAQRRSGDFPGPSAGNEAKTLRNLTGYIGVVHRAVITSHLGSYCFGYPTG